MNGVLHFLVSSETVPLSVVFSVFAVSVLTSCDLTVFFNSFFMLYSTLTTFLTANILAFQIYK